MKIWEDSNNRDGKRPAAVTVHLFANNVEVAQQTISAGADGQWRYSFADLPKHDKYGVEIQYHVTEDVVPGYATVYSGSNIVNRYTPGKTSIPVIKWWDDGNDYDRIRPLSVTVRLFADKKPTDKILVLSRANGWQSTFEDLDLYADGKLIVYEIVEDNVLYYKTRISGDQLNGYSIVNYHRVEKPNGNWPRTGDDSNVKAWLIPFALSGVLLAGGAAGGVIYHRKKKKETENEE